MKNKGTLFFEIAVKQKNGVNTSNVLGFNWLIAHVWRHEIIEFEYTKGDSKKQDYDFLINTFSNLYTYFRYFSHNSSSLITMNAIIQEGYLKQ